MEYKQVIKVLVVDDEKVVREFLVRLLSLEDIEVKAAEDGLKAIEIAKKEKFDLIFLDVRMPNLDGLQTLKELKKTAPAFTRYVMITGYAVDDMLEQAKVEGATTAIKKPFEIGEILNQLSEVRRLKKAV